jgi:hypothetical protein
MLKRHGLDPALFSFPLKNYDSLSVLTIATRGNAYEINNGTDY